MYIYVLKSTIIILYIIIMIHMNLVNGSDDVLFEGFPGPLLVYPLQEVWSDQLPPANTVWGCVLGGGGGGRWRYHVLVYSEVQALHGTIVESTVSVEPFTSLSTK